MAHIITWFEIPTTDLHRATGFYERVLGTSLKHFARPDKPMAVFPGDEQAVRGALIQDQQRRPAGEGVTIYLHAPDLDQCLARVEPAGGRVMVPKTSIGEQGFFALVRDTEGNVVGLHAPR
jgi:predicted enzyme related to lactoylglutathione lyase